MDYQSEKEIHHLKNIASNLLLLKISGKQVTGDIIQKIKQNLKKKNFKEFKKCKNTVSYILQFYYNCHQKSLYK